MMSVGIKRIRKLQQKKKKRMKLNSKETMGNNDTNRRIGVKKG